MDESLGSSISDLFLEWREGKLELEDKGKEGIQNLGRSYLWKTPKGSKIGIT